MFSWGGAEYFRIRVGVLRAMVAVQGLGLGISITAGLIGFIFLFYNRFFSLFVVLLLKKFAENLGQQITQTTV